MKLNKTKQKERKKIILRKNSNLPKKMMKTKKDVNSVRAEGKKPAKKRKKN